MIKFGPSGNCQAFYNAGYKHTVQAPLFCREMSLNCYEYSFGRGVTMSEKTALEIGRAFSENDIEISVHAPYFINFANPRRFCSSEIVRLRFGQCKVFKTSRR